MGKAKRFVLLATAITLCFLSGCGNSRVIINNNLDNNSSDENNASSENIANEDSATNNQQSFEEPSADHIHNYAGATCTSPETCNICGITKGAPLGHSFSPANCTTPSTCTVCEVTTGEALGHSYVDNICSVCGATDPDSLPVSLDKLPVIDSTYEYKFYNEALRDNFGNTYVGYHDFPEEVNTAYAIYNLNGEYSTFSCDVFTFENDVTFAVYVDEVKKFQEDSITKTKGKIHVEIDVKNGQQLKILSTNNEYSWSDTVIVVNAQLEK